MFDDIEKLKQDYTDKYVVVAPGVPELARFGGHVGQVKTVNMNGRALVEFDAWNNIGWYDIDLGFLRVVPKPEPATEAKAHDKKPAAAPAAKAAPAAQPGEKKLSPLEMARQQGAAKPAGAKPAAPAAPAGAKQSTADILAAARANKAAAAPAAADSSAVATETAKPAPAPAAKPKAAAAEPALPPGQRLSIPQILDWCRQHDAK